MNKTEQQTRIAQLEKELAELKEMKFKTPEETFLEMWNGCTIHVDKEKYPSSIFWMKDGQYVFELQKTSLWCIVDYVWDVFSKQYNMGYDEIQSFIKDKVEEHFKMNGVTPRTSAVR